MPRDGSDIYTRPFPDVDEDTTIESAVYNGFTADVAIDLNTPRPIVAGGTGAPNARDARIALGAETAGQVVTNYDSHVWMAGSFYSSTTPGQGAPVDGHAFLGNVYMSDPSNIVVEARDQNDTVVPGRLYVREKKAGAWGTWKLDGRFNAPGGVDGISSDSADMFYGVRGTAPTSAFIINTESDASGVDIFAASKNGVIVFKSLVASTVQVFLDAIAGKANNLIGSTAGLTRWAIQLGDGIVEGAGNVGSDFRISRHDNAGLLLGTPIAINRATGRVDINGAEAATKAYVDSAIAALKAVPAGTVMLFYQAAAPVGFTRVTTQHDKSLRVVGATAGGVAGGTNAFSTVMAQTATQNHTLATSSIPSGIPSSGNNSITVYPGGDASGYYFPTSLGGWVQLGAVGGGFVPQRANPFTEHYYSSATNGISVGSTGGGGAHSHPLTMDMQYVDVILASRDP